MQKQCAFSARRNDIRRGKWKFVDIRDCVSKEFLSFVKGKHLPHAFSQMHH
jgi:hypothetical protein